MEPTSGIKLFYAALGTADPTTALAHIRSLPSLPKQTTDTFETTEIDQLDGTEHDWCKHFEMDHIDPGTLNPKLALDPTQTAALYAINRAKMAFKILFASGNSMIFDGAIITIGPEVQDKQDVLVDVVIKVDSLPVYTVAA